MSESIPRYDAWKLRSPYEPGEIYGDDEEDEIEGDLDEIRADLYEDED